MVSTPSPTPSIRDSTVQAHAVTGTGSFSKRNSVSSIDKQTEDHRFAAEKALEKAPEPYDESKILHGRKLFFAFVAMLLSVLLIALGAFSSYIYSNCRGLILFAADQTRP
jgi:hypothetical protein